jgi:hypothetical protein
MDVQLRESESLWDCRIGDAFGQQLVADSHISVADQKYGRPLNIQTETLPDFEGAALQHPGGAFRATLTRIGD